MATLASHSKRSSSVKRLLQEAKELRNLKSEGIYAEPLEDSIHEFHFTIEGPKDSEFEGGIYHGRICLPSQYPFKPPDIMLLTPNGRFELNKKVCLTITGFHEESWQPAWGIRTALVGLSSFFSTEAKGAIGGLDTPASERKRLAALSREWTCSTCQTKNCDILPQRSESQQTSSAEASKQGADAPQKVLNESSALAAAGTPIEQRTSAATENLDSSADKDSALAQCRTTIDTSAAASQSSPPSLTESPTPKQIPAPSSIGTFTAPSTPSRQSVRPVNVPRTSSSTSASQQQPQRAERSPSVSRRQQVQERHLQVVELLTRQLALNDPSAAAAAGGVHQTAAAGQSVAFAAPTSASGGRGGSSQGNNRNLTPPPIWLDAAIGGILIALASLIFRKVM